MPGYSIAGGQVSFILPGSGYVTGTDAPHLELSPLAFTTNEGDFINYIVPRPLPVPAPPELVDGSHALYITAYDSATLPAAAELTMGNVSREDFKTAVETYVQTVAAGLREEFEDRLVETRTAAAPMPVQDLHAAVKAALADLSAEIAALKAGLEEARELGRMTEQRRGELKALTDALAGAR
jgi:hypothetical protein